VRLADGTRIMLAGATHLSIDPAARSAKLDDGQATFEVAHDPGRPFVVRLGDARVTDVGTIFDIRRRDGRSVVAVARGEVRVDGVGDPIALTAGRRLRFAGALAPQLDTVAPNMVTGWQKGRFSYADAPISDVVADIEQATGARIRMAPGVAGLRFAGTLAIDRDAGRALHDVAPVLGLSLVRDGKVWVLSSSRDSRPR
jgi:transmembrane sensor